MKYSTATLLLSLATAAVADVNILDQKLHPSWSIFDPSGTAAEMVGTAHSAAIHAKNLAYVTGVNVQCVPGSAGCAALRPPHYDGDDRWLVTNIIVPNAGSCPGPYDAPGTLENSLGVQFYKQDNRMHASMPVYLARMDASRGGIAKTYGGYTSCVKVPLYCKDTGENFVGWTGISYQNRPLKSEDCAGPLDFYIDSIKVSSRCPFHVGDNKDLAPDNFCIDRGDGDKREIDDDGEDYRGVCNDSNKFLSQVASSLRK